MTTDINITDKEIMKHNNEIITAHYVDWFTKIAVSLRKFADPSTVEESVANAIDKVMGLHDRFHLRETLPLMDEAQLYVTIQKQAKWLVGHERDRFGRFDPYVEINESEDEAPTRRIPPSRLTSAIDSKV